MKEKRSAKIGFWYAEMSFSISLVIVIIRFIYSCLQKPKNTMKTYQFQKLFALKVARNSSDI